MPKRATRQAWVSLAAIALSCGMSLPAMGQSLGAATRIALMPSGDVIVSDYTGGRVLTLDGAWLSVKQSLFINGRASGIAVTADSLYVGNDTSGDVEIYRLDRKGGWKANGRLGKGKRPVPKPNDIAVDEVRGLVFAVSAERQKVLVFDTAGHEFGSIAGPPDPGQEQTALFAPTGIAVDPATQRVFVSDFGDPTGFFSQAVPARVQIYSYASETFGVHFGMISGDLGFSRPQGLALDRSGRTYVVDSFRGEVLVFENPGGGWSLVGTFGGRGVGLGQLMHPMDAAIDPGTQDVLVTSRQTARVEVFLQGSIQP